MDRVIFCISEDVLFEHSINMRDSIQILSEIDQDVGRSESNPVLLLNVTAEEFEALCDFVYSIDFPYVNLSVSCFPSITFFRIPSSLFGTVEALSTLLKASILFAVPSGVFYALGTLDDHEGLTDIQRLSLAYEFGIIFWMRSGVQTMIKNFGGFIAENLRSLDPNVLSVILRAIRDANTLHLDLFCDYAWTFSPCDCPAICRLLWDSLFRDHAAGYLARVPVGSFDIRNVEETLYQNERVGDICGNCLDSCIFALCECAGQEELLLNGTVEEIMDLEGFKTARERLHWIQDFQR